MDSLTLCDFRREDYSYHFFSKYLPEYHSDSSYTQDEIYIEILNKEDVSKEKIKYIYLYISKKTDTKYSCCESHLSKNFFAWFTRNGSISFENIYEKNSYYRRSNSKHIIISRKKEWYNNSQKEYIWNRVSDIWFTTKNNERT